jgi:superfamily II DNA or RNA helicase
MKKMRLHQIELKTLAERIVKGEVTKKIFTAHISPGSGKSLAAAVFARELLQAGKIDRVVWVCPRSSLVQQGADGFRDPDFNPKYSARAADNTSPLFREVNSGKICYCTTYQALSAKPQLHFKECSLYKYLLILDEPHHLKDNEAEDALWTKSTDPLVDNAQYVLLMSGTIERHDKKLLPYVTYEEDSGYQFPKKDVEYSRFDALLEEAIIPIEFEFEKGWANFEDDHGEHNVEISNATDEEVSAVIQTFLGKTEFRDRLLTRGLEHWVEQRKKYKSRCITICASQDMARAVAKQTKELYPACEVALAISDDTRSDKIIKAFRRKEFGHNLVTVGMAYEGLDVPDCKHLICLTDIRSQPWLEQAFARVTRVDYNAIANGIPYSEQKAHIFVPDDPRMQKIVASLKSEQDKGIKIKQERAKLEEEKEKAAGSAPGMMFRALGATSSGTETGTLNAQGIEEVLATFAPPIVIEEDEKEVRKKIEMLARRRDKMRRLPPSSTNKLLMSQFGKPRNRMGVVELRKVLVYLTDLIRMGS